jgi:hypothetical protein
MYRKFAIHALIGFRTCSPNHAPAGFRATSALEQALKISPARGIMKLQFGHTHNDTATAPAFNSLNCRHASGHRFQSLVPLTPTHPNARGATGSAKASATASHSSSEETSRRRISALLSSTSTADTSELCHERRFRDVSEYGSFSPGILVFRRRHQVWAGFDTS